MTASAAVLGIVALGGVAQAGTGEPPGTRAAGRRAADGHGWQGRHRWQRWHRHDGPRPIVPTPPQEGGDQVTAPPSVPPTVPPEPGQDGPVPVTPPPVPVPVGGDEGAVTLPAQITEKPAAVPKIAVMPAAPTGCPGTSCVPTPTTPPIRKAPQAAGRPHQVAAGPARPRASALLPDLGPAGGLFPDLPQAGPGGLPFTGVNALPLAALGLSSVLLGGGVVAGTRIRRRPVV
ncbi:hypothetical protein [Actinomadura macrotermitis]|uniref:Gram-positive cocci surface proteins LPxTG domain-containing protein n=1 Tax=Actinomadura macrotermitis TaxID=2585200 RepID=A0A7K0BPR2_9ACTN|nr:hypothetical protein [Actinomadura macrotermitis]MQY03066.1 hypothetical protein [Actinomadura macrotermitis]